MTKPKKNNMFPGRDNYTGPKSGVFGLLHHALLCETSRNVMERVRYVQLNKPNDEIEIRLHNMIYLGDCPAATKLDALYADYLIKRAGLYADYEAKLDALYDDYLAKHVALDDDYAVKRAALYADSYEAKHDALYDDYLAKRAALETEIVAHIRKHIPDCAWNGSNLGWKYS